jgi:competence protein ComEA
MIRCLAFPVVALLLFAAVPTSASAQDAAGAAQSAAAPRPGPQVNINAATAEQLEELPGVGPKTAARIVEYRQKNGGFKKVEDLMNVRGLGEKNFLKIKPFITVGASRTDRAGGQ